MQGTTHRLGGMATGALIPAVATLIGEGGIYSNYDIGAIIAGAAIGSLVPDLDSKYGLMSEKLKLTSAVVRKVTGHRGFTHTLVALVMYAVICIICGGSLERMAKVKGLGIGIAITVAVILGTCGGFCYTVFRKITLGRVYKKHLAEVTCGCFLLGFALTIYDPVFVANLMVEFLIGSIFGYANHLLMDCFTVSGMQLFKPFNDYEVHLGKCRTGSNWRNLKPDDFPKKGDSKQVKESKALARKKAKGHPGEPVYAFVSVLIFTISLAIIFVM